MIVEVLKQLTSFQNLDYDVMKTVMFEITNGELNDIQIAAFLTALKMKGETPGEICAACEVLKNKCIKTDIKDGNTLDIVGTGGDGANTFNISTAASFVAAAGGIPVSKHGNRAYSSKCGSMDVLEALGINVNINSEQETELFEQTNLCFMNSVIHHPAAKYASTARKELKFRTLFNILGPLVNPACAKYRVFGVYDKNLVRTCAEVLSQTDMLGAIVVHGKDGLDEATLTGDTYVSELRNGRITDYVINPKDFGLKTCSIEDIKGDNSLNNAKIIRDIFENKENGAKKDIVILNSALAFYIYNKVSTIKDGVKYATAVIDSGLALNKLNKYAELSRRV